MAVLGVEPWSPVVAVIARSASFRCKRRKQPARWPSKRARYRERSRVAWCHRETIRCARGPGWAAVGLDDAALRVAAVVGAGASGLPSQGRPGAV